MKVNAATTSPDLGRSGILNLKAEAKPVLKSREVDIEMPRTQALIAARKKSFRATVTGYGERVMTIILFK